MSDTKKSIVEMNGGAFLERIDYAMSQVFDNILDPDTKATAKRKLTITFTLAPDDSRTNIITDLVIKPTLATTNPIVTSLYVTGIDGTGEVQVVEMVPQIPGQFAVDGAEQTMPPVLKLVKTS